MVKTKEELINDIKIYFDEIVNARTYLQIHKAIMDAINTKNDQVNYAPVFFRYAERSFVDSTLLVVMKLFDSNDSAKTLRKLLCTCKHNYKLFSTEKRFMILMTYIFGWVFRERIKSK